MSLSKGEGYFLSVGESLVGFFSELFPVMDLAVLPIAGPIFGISFSILCAAPRTPRARSSTVRPLLRSVCCDSAHASPLVATQSKAKNKKHCFVKPCRFMVEL